ncbi:MAG: InlB B-repeat-containing protein [Tenericutes bacterium]|nr:InlB B-repeat-containing protein [Mycoplasmatota bacterium]
MKKIIFAMIALLSLSLVMGCSGKEVTVSFEENGGNPITNKTVIQKTTLEEFEGAREGYTFLGWYEDVELTTLFDFDTVILRNITLYAKWEINEYEITFVLDNGEEDFSYIDEYNTTIEYPEDPVKVGYDFSGWFTDELQHDEFSANRVPSENITVYAGWTEKELLVNFYLDSDSDPIYSEYVLYGEAVASAPAIPLVTGMNGTWSEDITNITEDLDVYVAYTKKVFTITFKDFEGNTYNTVSKEYGDSITLPENPIRVGYDFIGYYSEDLERNIDFSSYTVTENLELMDSFQIKTFSVKFFGGETNALLGSVEYIDYGTSALAPTTGLERLGYTFTGWDVAFDNVTSDLNVYAQYTINQYLATFDANGGVFTNLSETIVLLQDYNSNVTVPEVPIKDGFIFVGWYTDKTYENEIYFGTGIPLAIDGFTVYAKWLELVATRYTVSGTYYFEEIGISTDELSLDGMYTTTSSESYTPFINVLYDTDMSPVRDIEGYVFYKYVYEGQEYFDQSTLINIQDNATVDVYYRRVVLSVSFSETLSGINTTTTYYVFYNESLTNVPSPTEVTGMTVAWEQQNFDNIKANLSVVAIQYDNSLQTVIFRSNGTIIYMTSNEAGLSGTVVLHTIVITEESPLWDMQQTGYRFLGWFIEGTDTEVTLADLYFDDAYFASNITTIEARWLALNALNEATGISVDADAASQTITIDFSVLPTNDVYPSDFVFILNGEFIQSSDISMDSLMNYITQTGNDFSLVLTETDAYYDFFKENLMSSVDNYESVIPGTHSLQIISVGDDFLVTSSNPSTVFQYKVASIYEGIPESSTVKDYYIIEDFGSGTLRYIFYANLTYQFQGMTFTIEEGSNIITADGNKLTTSDIAGDFLFTITDDSGSRTYSGLVVKDIRQFDIGTSYQNYFAQVNDLTEDNTFLADTVDAPYYVGASNDFYLDILIRDNNGAKIALEDAFINYEFYLNGSLVALDALTVLDYVTVTDNIMDFTDLAIGNEFRIVIEPKYEATLMDMDALEFNILVNDGYNAFTNSELKTLYKNLNVNYINIHRDIEAVFSANQVYEDGSPINKYATPTNNYNEIGNVYYRINGNTDDDQITLEGNFMTIDGSNLEYINPDQEGFGNIVYAQGFDIVSTQIGIFYYNVSQTTPVNNNVFTMNNLKIIGNTTTPSVNYSGTEEEIYNQERLMSQNSGGILGVVVRNGKASLNNLVIGYTVIGVTTNAYGENTNHEVLTIDLDYVTIYDSWANSIYLYSGSGVLVEHSNIGSSGGAAIHFEDVKPGAEIYDNPVLILGDGNEINNWISGQESWFKAYAMSSVALVLKSSINSSISGLEKTIIQMRENPVTGLDTEMMNLIFLSLPKNGAVTYSNPDDSTSVITASEVNFDITDSTGNTVVARNWNFTEELWPLDATTSIVDPRVSGGQYGFALGNLSDTYAFLGMITDIMTAYYGAYGAMMSEGDAGNLAAIAGFYNLTATEVLQVAGGLAGGLSIHEAVIAIKGTLDYPQAQYIEVIAPLSLTGAAGNATILIEMFNSEDE